MYVYVFGFWIGGFFVEIDFHHTAIYALCRLAGMKSIYAEKVAYASQQVDNANFDHALKFKNGGVFHQTRTSHEDLAFLRMVDVNDAFNIWIPFHFLPSGEGDNMSDALVTRPEGKSITLLKKELIELGSYDYGLHYLGIFFHIYADAYSHQDFKGFFDPYNQIKVIQSEDSMTFKNYLLHQIVKRVPGIFPVGHAVAAKNPDIPFAVWSYLRGNEEIKVNNLKDRFIPAVVNIFGYLVDYLEENPQYGRPIASSLSEENMKKIIKLLKRTGSYQQRHQNWLEMIHNNGFGFSDFDEIDSNLAYDRRSWFNKAALAVKAKGVLERLEYASYNYHKFERKNLFNKADWTLFMRAAAIHKYKLLHETLPACGLYIG